jgi:hypothetical protein
MHIWLASAGLARVVEAATKKIFRNQANVAFTPHFFREKIAPVVSTFVECT